MLSRERGGIRGRGFPGAGPVRGKRLRMDLPPPGPLRSGPVRFDRLPRRHLQCGRHLRRSRLPASVKKNSEPRGDRVRTPICWPCLRTISEATDKPLAQAPDVVPPRVVSLFLHILKGSAPCGTVTVSRISLECPPRAVRGGHTPAEGGLGGLEPCSHQPAGGRATTLPRHRKAASRGHRSTGSRSGPPRVPGPHPGPGGRRRSDRGDEPSE